MRFAIMLESPPPVPQPERRARDNRTDRQYTYWRYEKVVCFLTDFLCAFVLAIGDFIIQLHPL